MYQFGDPDTGGHSKPYYNPDLDCPCGFNSGSISQRAVCLPSAPAQTELIRVTQPCG